MPLRYFPIRYGIFDELETLIDPETRDIWITQKTLRVLLGWDDNNDPKKLKSKSLKVFTGEHFTTLKNYRGKDIAGKDNNFKIMPFGFAREVILWEATEHKNINAILLLRAGFNDSFTSIALEQAGVQVSLAERQETIKFYLERYHAMFDWVRDQHIKIYGCRPDQEYYQRINVVINLALFGRYTFEGNRKLNAETDQLRELENLQMFFMRKSLKYGDLDPLDAIKSFLEEYL